MRPLSGSALPEPAAPARPGLLLHDIVAKQESDFHGAPRLVIANAQRAESVPCGGAERVDIGKFSANKEPAVLKRGRNRDRCGRTAWTVHQIEGNIRSSIPTRLEKGARTARNVFPAA